MERLSNSDEPFCGAIDAIGARNKPVAVLAFYGDDSGSSPQDGLCLVGGYISLGKTWFYDLEVPWVEALKQPPSIDYFKAVECAKQFGQFKYWNQDDCDSKLGLLTDVVTASAGQLVEYSSCIWWKDFHALSDAVKAVYSHPYHYFLYSRNCQS